MSSRISINTVSRHSNKLLKHRESLVGGKRFGVIYEYSYE
mgnify:CR=1 FL=1